MSNCIFCKIAQHEINSYTLYEDDKCIAILDLSQATYGHTLVISKEHAKNILEVSDETLMQMSKVVKNLSLQIKEKLNAAGINVLTNANEAAGQTVMHFHIHIIPRYDEHDGFKPQLANNEGKYDLEKIKQQIM